MIEKINDMHVLYSVELQLDRDQIITVGKLGTFHFQRGTYIYIGSAKRAIISRLNRHKKVDKVKRWHIDYLRPFCEITKIITYELGDGECSLAEKLRKTKEGTLPIPGFGASDCKCRSHLIYLGAHHSKKEQSQSS
ncbi:GIY-YIG nuclease family protein [Bacillus sp. DNRA2]|uniref:GIY-YIG nuclease family protein n=1 Tax=Bacillus sp. DNRA2 TaxID=2723053 RepID=UPI00145D7498|nr:GIY-YIG nuclease family protein [Bacillus sp. DNRA2]NMD72813.1 GIY-YIG nuclease family protein [Bacillus sp. DNRA2]